MSTYSNGSVSNGGVNKCRRAYEERNSECERATPDDQAIVPKTRDEYVADYSHLVEMTARSNLQMHRVVYEAQQSLPHGEFKDFCEEIGSDAPRLIRKHVAIGKSAPQMIRYSNRYPIWSVLLFIMQMPHDTFPASEFKPEIWDLENYPNSEGDDA
jgi:hypothetical protein